MKVVVSSVTKQHSYPIALVAHQKGYLKQFMTGIYYDAHKARYRLLERAIHSVRGNGDLARLHVRRQEGLPDSYVTAIAWPEVIEQVWRRMPLLPRIVHPDSVYYLRNEAFDHLASRRLLPCDLFHGFEQCALFSLRRAKEMGAVRLLDEPVIHRALWDRLEADERRKLGLPPAERHYWYQQHVDRKYRELELADYLLVGLEFVRKSFVDEGFPADRIFLVPYGADVRKREQPIVRPRRRTFNILFVGQISWYKGLHYFLDAYDRLNLPDVNLTILGMVHPEWFPYFHERFKRVKNPLNYIGTVAHSQIEQYFADADVFVFPSIGGGVGLATFEAMAAGLPVITSDGDVVIRNGIDGLVVPPEDTEGWVAALKNLHANPELRLQLGASATERVQSFTWENYQAGIIKAYEEIARRESLR